MSKPTASDRQSEPLPRQQLHADADTWPTDLASTGEVSIDAGSVT